MIGLFSPIHAYSCCCCSVQLLGDWPFPSSYSIPVAIPVATVFYTCIFIPFVYVSLFYCCSEQLLGDASIRVNGGAIILGFRCRGNKKKGMNIASSEKRD